MGSGDPPGLQNRREAGLPVFGAFDSHTLPPSQLQEKKPLVTFVIVQCSRWRSKLGR